MKKEKNFVMQNRFGLLPKLYCEKKILYCKAELYCSLRKKKLYCEIVLQGRLKVKEIVLHYSHCIAEKKA